MEEIIQNINGEAYLMFEIKLSEQHKSEINEFIADFSVIDQTMSLPLSDALVRKVLIPCKDVERFQKGIKEIDSKIATELANWKKSQSKVFGIALMIVLGIMIYLGYSGFFHGRTFNMVK